MGGDLVRYGAGCQVLSSNTHITGGGAPAAGGDPDNEPGRLTEGLPAAALVADVSAGDSHSACVTRDGGA